MTENSTCPGRILIGDGDADLLARLRKTLERERYRVDIAADGEQVVSRAAADDYDLLLLDLQLPPTGGLAVLQQVKQVSAGTVVCVITSDATVESAVQSLKSGAVDYLVKPVAVERLLQVAEAAMKRRRLGARRRQVSEQLQAAQRQNRRLETELRSQYASKHLLGSSQAMRALHDMIQEVADTDSTVLILGESGTGKGVIARAIHFGGERVDRPFVVANCTIYSEGVLHSELFGHEKGAFTGALREKPGRFEMAADGTVFLDELGDLSASTQVMLLRVLQERKFERVGGEKTLTMNARVIAATNRDLRQSVRDGRFREDLFYRLNVIPIQVPPLRERADDIPTLAMHFMGLVSDRLKKPVQSFSAAALEVLSRYVWPGNIRELENAVERAVVMAKEEEIQAADLPPEIREGEIPLSAASFSLHELERRHVLGVLEAHGWNKKKSAQALGIDRSSLYNKLKRWGIQGPRDQPGR